MISRRFLAFVAVSGFAAAANFGSRIAFSQFMPYVPAIVAAFCIGLTTAFVLNRRLVFRDSTRSVHQQALWFTLVNLFALVQTIVISLLLARHALPALGMTAHADTIAHAVGVATPVLTSFFAHKHLSFR
ncbi:GtrA family protein [Tahibacter caeni]|uniref:GtrA family protein n=1 Tax=Tahibacter caeni TaxID=1453545 RepID=UPI002148DDA3|nr:GtrA family protein [Tahibacter caeni]